MGSSDWDAKVMQSFDNFLRESFCECDELLDYYITKSLAAQEVCEDRALMMTSKQNTPDLDSHDEGAGEKSDDDIDSESESQPPKQRRRGSATVIPTPSEYEIARAANVVRNKELAEQLDGKYREKYGELLPELDEAPPKPARKKRERKNDKTMLRRSTRNNQEP